MSELRETPDRYEWVEGGDVLALADRVVDGPVVTITHVETPPALRGRGYASALVEAALDRIRAGGGRVVPACPFARAWVREHPAYQDLLQDRSA